MTPKQLKALAEAECPLFPERARQDWQGYVDALRSAFIAGAQAMQPVTGRPKPVWESVPVSELPPAVDWYYTHESNTLNPSLSYTRNCHFWNGMYWCDSEEDDAPETSIKLTHWLREVAALPTEQPSEPANDEQIELLKRRMDESDDELRFESQRYYGYALVAIEYAAEQNAELRKALQEIRAKATQLLQGELSQSLLDIDSIIEKHLQNDPTK